MFVVALEAATKEWEVEETSRKKQRLMKKAARVKSGGVSASVSDDDSDDEPVATFKVSNIPHVMLDSCVFW